MINGYDNKQSHHGFFHMISISPKDNGYAYPKQNRQPTMLFHGRIVIHNQFPYLMNIKSSKHHTGKTKNTLGVHTAAKHFKEHSQQAKVQRRLLSKDSPSFTKVRI